MLVCTCFSFCKQSCYSGYIKLSLQSALLFLTIRRGNFQQRRRGGWGSYPCSRLSMKLGEGFRAVGCADSSSVLEVRNVLRLGTPLAHTVVMNFRMQNQMQTCSSFHKRGGKSQKFREVQLLRWRCPADNWQSKCQASVYFFKIPHNLPTTIQCQPLSSFTCLFASI